MIRIRSAAIVTLLATSAVAEDRSALYGSIIDVAMQDMRMFLTCTLLERESYEFLRKEWQATVADTLTFLTEEGVTPPNLAAFAASAQPDALVPAPDTPISEVIAFCTTETSWVRRLHERDYTRLPYDLEKAAE